jgi:hypothetical protein
MTKFTSLNTTPGAIETLLKASATSFKKAGKNLPNVGYSIDSISIDPEQYQGYCKMFGFNGKTVPSTYWFIRLFGVRTLLSAHPEAPFPMPGMVHLSNHIEQLEIIYPSETLRMECTFGKLLNHEKGTAFESIVTLFKGSKVVFKETSVFLYLGKKGIGTDEVFNPSIDITMPVETEKWELPTNMGISYAKVSGDFNPIHLHTIGAKLFGFPKHLIHGWYSVSKTVARMQDKLSQPHELFVSFKKPLFLPGSVISRIHETNNEITFDLIDAKEGFPHMKGYLKF